MKRPITHFAFAVLLVGLSSLSTGTGLAQDGQYEAANQKDASPIRVKPETGPAEPLKPKGSGVLFMMSEKGLEVLSPFAPPELGYGEKNTSRNIDAAEPSSRNRLAYEDRREWGGIALLGFEY